MAVASLGALRRVTADRSAPAMRKYGLPVMAKASISPFLARSACTSKAARSSSKLLGPKVVGFLWSRPLSKVSNASVLPLGKATSLTKEWVTVSSCISSATTLKFSLYAVIVSSLRLAAEVRVVWVFPDDGAAHAQADAHGGDAIAHRVVFGEL